MYTTIKDISTAVFKDRGSRFLAFAHHIDDAQQAKQVIDSYKKKYHDARHVCYAFVARNPQEVQKSSDDGEPSGTAGKPILNQIQSKGLVDVVVVVVRYFGGVLLGTPGLVNAYKTASKDALEQANIIIVEEYTDYSITYPYELTQQIIDKVQKCGGRIVDNKYDNHNIVTTLSIPTNNTDIFNQWLDKQYLITAKMAHD